MCCNARLLDSRDLLSVDRQMFTYVVQSPSCFAFNHCSHSLVPTDRPEAQPPSNHALPLQELFTAAEAS